jgi:hypothetical protein
MDLQNLVDHPADVPYSKFVMATLSTIYVNGGLPKEIGDGATSEIR